MLVIKILKGVREHWKKSAFATGAFAYGISYANERYEINEIMRKYCEEAVKYGDLPQDSMVPSKRVVVILNPAANKKSAEKTFKKYCEPILHLSGMLVDVIKTDSEGHARRYVESMNKLPDAILVAGGDGTLSETITGLMRRSINEKCPIGILPLGRTNSVAQKVHNTLNFNSSGLDEVQGLAETTMSVVRGKTQKKDVMKIEVIENENENEISEKSENITSKPIFAMGSLQWGAFRDIQSLRDKYWYVGPFREYASALFNAFNDKLTWNCKTKIIYTPPCLGCSNCYVKPQQKILTTGRWWSRFIPKFGSTRQSLTGNAINEPDYSKVKNEDCSQQNQVEINPVEILLSANSNNTTENIPKLEIFVRNSFQSSFDFITEYWERIKTKEIKDNKEIEARTIEIVPGNISTDNNEIFYSIDSEAYEVKPIKIILLPKAVDIFTS